MKTVIETIVLLLFPFLLYAQNDLDKRNLLENKIEMLVPISFQKMTDAEYKIKYPNPKRKASLILTDKEMEVNLVIDHMQQYPLSTDQIEEFKNMQLVAIQKSHPESKLLGNAMKDINGKKFGYFKVMTQAIDQKIFNYFVFTNLDEKILLMSFNCVEKLMPKWEKSIDKMFESFTIIK